MDLKKNVTLTVLRMCRVVSDLRMEVVKSYVVKRMKSERMSFFGMASVGFEGVMRCLMFPDVMLVMVSRE